MRKFFIALLAASLVCFAGAAFADAPFHIGVCAVADQAVSPTAIVINSFLILMIN